MTYHLQIVTPNGLVFDGQAVRLTVPTIDGQVGILARHINYVTAIGMGMAKLVMEDEDRTAACIGGMLAVTDGEVKLLATSFEWANEIDTQRARISLEKGEAVLADPNADEQERQYAAARVKRAKVRLSVAKE